MHLNWHLRTSPTGDQFNATETIHSSIEKLCQSHRALRRFIEPFIVRMKMRSMIRVCGLGQLYHPTAYTTDFPATGVSSLWPSNSSQLYDPTSGISLQNSQDVFNTSSLGASAIPQTTVFPQRCIVVQTTYYLTNPGLLDDHFLQTGNTFLSNEQSLQSLSQTRRSYISQEEETTSLTMRVTCASCARGTIQVDPPRAGETSPCWCRMVPV